MFLSIEAHTVVYKMYWLPLLFSSCVAFINGIVVNMQKNTLNLKYTKKQNKW